MLTDRLSFEFFTFDQDGILGTGPSIGDIKNVCWVLDEFGYFLKLPVGLET